MKKERIHIPSNTTDILLDRLSSQTDMFFLREGISALNSGKGTPHELIDEDAECIKPGT